MEQTCDWSCGQQPVTGSRRRYLGHSRGSNVRLVLGAGRLSSRAKGAEKENGDQRSTALKGGRKKARKPIHTSIHTKHVSKLIVTDVLPSSVTSSSRPALHHAHPTRAGSLCVPVDPLSPRHVTARLAHALTRAQPNSRGQESDYRTSRASRGRDRELAHGLELSTRSS